MKYLNLKHESDNISFQCASQPFDYCGKQRYQCDSNGLLINLPNNNTKHLLYGSTSPDEFFAPYFEIASDGEMLWPYSMNQSLVDYANFKRTVIDVVQVRNPNWVAYPAWNTLEHGFNKFIQCQKRMYSGVPNQFPSCVDTMYTGRDLINKTLSLKEYHGNSSIYFFNSSFSVNGSSEEKGQLPMHLWSGFKSYPYLFLGQSAGPEYYKETVLYLFNKQHVLNMQLSQKTLLYNSDREVPFQLPLPSDLTSSNRYAILIGEASLAQSVTDGTFARRFVETVDTWNAFRDLGKPKDYNGMPYKIPIGMASLERFSEFGLFVGI